jgi:hypothetical protein
LIVNSLAEAMYEFEAAVLEQPFSRARFLTASQGLEDASGQPGPRSTSELDKLDDHWLELYAHGAYVGLWTHMPARAN